MPRLCLNLTVSSRISELGTVKTGTAVQRSVQSQISITRVYKLFKKCIITLIIKQM